MNEYLKVKSHIQFSDTIGLSMITDFYFGDSKMDLKIKDNVSTYGYMNIPYLGLKMKFLKKDNDFSVVFHEWLNSIILIYFSDLIARSNVIKLINLALLEFFVIKNLADGSVNADLIRELVSKRKIESKDAHIAAMYFAFDQYMKDRNQKTNKLLLSFSAKLYEDFAVKKLYDNILLVNNKFNRKPCNNGPIVKTVEQFGL